MTISTHRTVVYMYLYIINEKLILPKNDYLDTLRTVQYVDTHI